jgi:cysteine desulfurase
MIYLDCHSTTPCDPRVIEEMLPFFSTYFANPASAHFFAEKAKDAIEKAKEQVAFIINAKSDNINFTASATEANNIILQGLWPNEYKHVITTNVEHSSIINCLKKRSSNIILEPVLKINKDGNINIEELEKILRNIKSKNILVSTIFANNEIGTIHPIKKIGSLCKKYEALFHTDATQAIGKVNIDVKEMNIFALTMSGHKIYGPKGVAVLYVQNNLLIEPIIHGGYQNIITSGTQNVPAIVGIGKACEILQHESEEENKKVRRLRDLLLKNLKKNIPDIIINGTMKNRLPNNLNITIKGIKAEILIKGLEDVIISGGSACTSGEIEPSHVIKALGTPYPECAIRFGLGRWTTETDINYASNRIINIVNNMRS